VLAESFWEGVILQLMNKHIKKLHAQKGLVPIIVVVLVVVAIVAGYGVYRYFGLDSASPTANPSVSEQPAARQGALEINFTETGNILNWNAQTESYMEEWTLLYEKPGNPAISVKLVFNDDSLCDLGEGESVCDKAKLSNGDRAKVEGNMKNGEVTVVNLTKL
jgi:hypothetical protein